MRKYIQGHANKEKTKPRLAPSPRIPWNLGKSYVIASRAIYANKGSWNMAMKRLFLDRCMRCGWDEAPCDVHHIIPKASGGAYTLDNGVILCPNCHRLTHTGRVHPDDLRLLRDAAQPINVAV